MNKILLYIGVDMNLTDDINESLYTIEDDSIYFTPIVYNIDGDSVSDRSTSYNVDWFRSHIYPTSVNFGNVYNKYKELKNLNKRIIKLKKI